MTDSRQQAHELIDRLPETQLSALVGLLETIVDPVAAALRNAPEGDEPESDDERQAVSEAREWLRGVEARVFHMREPWVGSAWSERDRMVRCCTARPIAERLRQ